MSKEQMLQRELAILREQKRNQTIRAAKRTLTNIFYDLENGTIQSDDIKDEMNKLIKVFNIYQSSLVKG